MQRISQIISEIDGWSELLEDGRRWMSFAQMDEIGENIRRLEEELAVIAPDYEPRMRPWENE